VSAWVVLAIWFGLQLLGTAWMQMLFNQGFNNVGGVAYWEHVGGFVLGMVLIKILPGQTEYSHGGWYTKEGKEVLPKR
jgi:membrane associated rhomboid family serine protease